MRALLILAVLLPLMVTVAWYLSRPILRRRQHARHLAELEQENARLDRLLGREADNIFNAPMKGGTREHYTRRSEDSG